MQSYADSALFSLLIIFYFSEKEMTNVKKCDKIIISVYLFVICFRRRLMKEYISRLKSGCGTPVFILWWVLRIAMLAAFILNFSADTFTVTGQIHIAFCFISTFFWELSLAMPQKSIFRLIPSSIHTVFNVGMTASAVLGVYFDMYYSVKLFDPIVQAFFGFVSVLYGYEIAYALVKKEHFAATKAMVFYAAFGVSFILFNVWELGEFFTDQFIGHLTGQPGNAQFWSVLLAEGTAREGGVIPALVDERAPLMDIMLDVIMHFLSAFAALIFINVFPYRLRGKYKYDIEYGNNIIEPKETVNSRK